MDRAQVDMGMTYDDLSVFGRLRQIDRCGPYTMFGKLVDTWGDAQSPSEVRDATACACGHGPAALNGARAIA